MAELGCLASCAEWKLPKVGMAMEGRKQRRGQFAHPHLEGVEAVVENSIRVGDRKAGMRLLLRMSHAGPAGARGTATNARKGLFDEPLAKMAKLERSAKSPSPEEASTSAPPILEAKNSERMLKKVSNLMHEAIYMKRTSLPNSTLRQLREEYLRLNMDYRQRALILLATGFGVDRGRVDGLIQHYLKLKSVDRVEESKEEITGDNGLVAARYRTERDLRAALVPLSSRLFEQMNGQVGGLKFLVDLRADLQATLKEKNLASLRALDGDLEGLFSTWLSPACLELHRITWNDPACLLEKIVTYEAVHPISNLYDLKRRLGSGRRCFGYFHPSIPGEPLVFIEVALTKGIEGSVQRVLSGEAHCDESEATTALFYSITSTQPGLKGIELGNFLIKRVVHLLQQEMPQIQTFVTLSPIPGYMQWLVSKLASQCKLAAEHGNEPSSFREDLLYPEEEELLQACRDAGQGSSVVGFMYDTLSSEHHDWIQSDKLAGALRPSLVRLCARYLLQEKKRGYALDPVANFHIRNGASVHQLHWMADTSRKGINASAGLMVNYLYRLKDIEINNQAYLNKQSIAASEAVTKYLGQQPAPGSDEGGSSQSSKL